MLRSGFPTCFVGICDFVIGRVGRCSVYVGCGVIGPVGVGTGGGSGRVSGWMVITVFGILVSSGAGAAGGRATGLFVRGFGDCGRGRWMFFSGGAVGNRLFRGIGIW